MTVKIVTDRTADLPHAMAKELWITTVPLNVHFGTEVYRDGVENGQVLYAARCRYCQETSRSISDRLALAPFHGPDGHT